MQAQFTAASCVGLLLAACVVDADGSPVGKPCPCPPGGYQCVDGVCVTGLDPVSSSGSGGGSQPTCLVPAADFRPTWSTPESVRWDWVNQGEQTDFFEYAVVVGTSEADVLAETGSAKIFDRTINPELGFYIAPREENTSPVVFTITDGLAPNRQYFAKLVVTDINGCRFTTPVAQTTTKLPPVAEIVIFEDELLGEAWVLPLEVVAGCGYDGSACVRCVAETCLDTDANPAPWDQLRLVQTIDLGGVSESAFVSGQAFLELYISLASPTPNYFTEIYLGDHDDVLPDTIRWWGVYRLPIRAQADASAYQKVQLPLNALVDSDGDALSFEQLQTTFDEAHVGGEFFDASEVRLDGVAVKW